MTRRTALLVVKTLLALLLLGAVGRQFYLILTDPRLEGRIPRPGLLPLAFAGLCYLAAHTLWAFYWSRLLREQGVFLPLRSLYRAYFVSQFGKYVPGKAWVLLLRVLLLRPYGVSTKVIAATATYETLTNMAAGALIALSLLPTTGRAVGWEWGSPQSLGLVAIALLPLGLLVMSRLGSRFFPRKEVPAPSLRLLALGFVQSCVGWLFLALSLHAAASSVGIAAEPLEELAATTLSYVAGFVVLVAPGGLGAREFVLQKILATRAQDPGSAEAIAVVTALSLRAAWTFFEFLAAAILWMLGRFQGK